MATIVLSLNSGRPANLATTATAEENEENGTLVKKNDEENAKKTREEKRKRDAGEKSTCLPFLSERERYPFFQC